MKNIDDDHIMEKKKQHNAMKRRKFLQTGSAFAAAAMFIPAGGFDILDLNNHNAQLNSIPTVTLNKTISY